MTLVWKIAATLVRVHLVVNAFGIKVFVRKIRIKIGKMSQQRIGIRDTKLAQTLKDLICAKLYKWTKLKLHIKWLIHNGPILMFQKLTKRNYSYLNNISANIHLCFLIKLIKMQKCISKEFNPPQILKQFNW